MDSKAKTMRTAGAWNIAMGTVAITVGVAIGVGCIVAGGRLLKGASK